jgi:hypothetical protein
VQNGMVSTPVGYCVSGSQLSIPWNPLFGPSTNNAYSVYSK